MQREQPATEGLRADIGHRRPGLLVLTTGHDGSVVPQFDQRSRALDRETQKTIVRVEGAGCEWSVRLQERQAPKATFEDGVMGFWQVLCPARVLQMKEPGLEEDDEVSTRWARARAPLS